MISIKESNPDISSVFREHLNFTKPYVEKIILFYLDFFKILLTFYDKNVSDKVVVNKIMDIKRKHDVGNYKSLLKHIVKAKTPLKNEDNLKLFKFKKDLLSQATKTKIVIDHLTYLLSDYEAILKFEINGYEKEKIDLLATWKKKYGPINFLLKGIFDYESWFLSLGTGGIWGPYQLAKRLNIKSCPYCNRSYTFSLTSSEGKKMGRPDFDHFLPKSSNPLLSLSFFNLIPACKTCNGPSVKSSKPVDYKSHLNPYEDNQKNSIMRFTYFPNDYEASIGKNENLVINLKYEGDSKKLKKKVEGNISLFYLKETYKHHTDIVKDIIHKRHIADDRYIETLQTTYSNFNLTREDAYRLAFGNYYNEEDFHKRPLAKLTKDIAIEMRTLIKVKKLKRGL